MCGGWFITGACDLDRFYGSEDGLCLMGVRWLSVDRGVGGLLADVLVWWLLAPVCCGVVSACVFLGLWWGCLSGWMSSVLVMRAGWLFVLPLRWGPLLGVLFLFSCGLVVVYCRVG